MGRALIGKFFEWKDSSITQGHTVGKGGIDILPCNEREAPVPPSHLQAEVEDQGNPESLSTATNVTAAPSAPKRLPRETGEDIGMGSPVPLSKEAVDIITRLRNMKVSLFFYLVVLVCSLNLLCLQDEDEDWSRWRDVVFRAKGKLRPSHMVIKPPPAQNRRKRGGKAEVVSTPPEADKIQSDDIPEAAAIAFSEISCADSNATTSNTEQTSPQNMEVSPPPELPQISLETVIEQAAMKEPAFDTTEGNKDEHLYCPDCYLPLHPDPKPEKLYIFLHALKYTTSLGEFSTEMPVWSAEGWTWDQS